MAFNPYNFYQPYQQPQYQMQPQYQAPQQTQPQDERIWVQNATAAEAYLVAPNSFVRLWDSSKPVFYEKKADMTGRPYPIEAYEYTKVTAAQQVQQSNAIDYSGEISALKRRIEALERGAMNEQSESNANDTGI